MPLNLFLILGIIQYGLISHARVMAKYAAYRAVRIGAMNHANRPRMNGAALLELLPIITPSLSTLGLGTGKLPSDMTGTIADFAVAAGVNTLTSAAGGALSSIGNFPPLVSVHVCGPLKSELAGKRDASTLYSSLGDSASSQEVDFDDPKAAFEDPGADVTDAAGFNGFMSTKLRIQVAFMYPMPIPFANWAISEAYLIFYGANAIGAGTGKRPPRNDNLLITDKGFEQVSENTLVSAVTGGGSGSIVPALVAAANLGIYIAPIYASYAMRMQSNFYLGDKDDELPAANDCRHAGAGEG
jgi:hypothetical protein